MCCGDGIASGGDIAGGRGFEAADGDAAGDTTNMNFIKCC